ncbi:MAG: TldD/PmbA family protein [Chloroflexi bacterium]|nr:MAG: TldD/PmbA family protein [Chloroflexota bacterium]
MRDLAERALDAAVTAGADYADCRVVDRRVQHLVVKNGKVVTVEVGEDEGLGVRVIAGGAWGFAGGCRLDAASVEETARHAVRIARASARLNPRPVHLAPLAPVSGAYRTPVEQDPFEVSLDAKLDLLMRTDEAMARVAQVTVRESNSFGRHQLCAGWEVIEGFDMPGNAERIATEAAALLTADRCPAGTMTVILDGTQAALQVHESCGHPTELDRVLGTEAAYAGMSFLTPELLGTFRYGSEQVTLTADSTRATGLGTFGWDDEGVPARRTMLVDKGIFSGYMTSRETAAVLGQESNGTMRADGWARLPLIRMTNVNLEPGSSSLDEMIATTKHGVYLETNRSWSIDDRRLNFQFGTQNAWEIVDGMRTRLVRNALYSGTTPEFWRSCDAVASDAEWRMWGVVNCGKGQPSQLMHVGHGAAPCRFQNVRVEPAQ